MNILAFETSCDETAAAVVADGRALRANVVLSQADMHALYGGVVPEIASRRHVEAMAPLAEQALREAGLARAEVDAVAVTCAPGLIGALLVGVNFAKGAALALQRPLIPVHHIRGHLAANYLAHPGLAPPFAALVASGGHTLLLDVRNYTDIRVLGSTCDDAAGEAFDKVARVLGLPYPGGAALETLAASGRDDAYRLPRPKAGDNPLDMSFSGLKTAVLSVINRAAQKGEPLDRAGLAASFTRAVAEILAGRTARAAEDTGRRAVALAGGVAANGRLRAALREALAPAGRTLYVPPPALCGDNAAMIAAQAFYEWREGRTAGMDLNGYANACVAGCENF